jgi:hemolysin type calcium-binding protein
MKIARAFFPLVLILSLLCLPSTSSAMQNLSSKNGEADPCAVAGVGDGGGIRIKRNTGGPKAEKRVDVLLQCSPKMEMPFGTLIANDIVANHIGSHRGEPFFQGNVENDGVNAWMNTLGTPFIKGEISEALRLQDFQLSKEVINALSGAGGGAASTLAISLIICAAGGIPTLGIACGGAAAVAGATIVAAVTGAVAAVVKDFFNAQLNRYTAMRDAQWFVWSNSYVAWNSFGDIADTWINPSITSVDPFGGTYVRIGVTYSNVPVGQGSDYNSAKDNGGVTLESGRPLTPKQERQLDRGLESLNFNTGRAGITPYGKDRVRTGDAGADLLLGAGGEDSIEGGGGRDTVKARGGDDVANGGSGPDKLSGGAGSDLLYGRSGGDVMRGGGAHDTLLGGSGRDLLAGGAGPDLMADDSGPTQVLTGPPTGPRVDLVNVRDGRDDDSVVCQSTATRVIADAGDTVSGDCGQVIRRGPLLRMPG